MIKKGCLDIVQSKCENCTDCILGKTRKNVVFSDGNPETAKIVLIGSLYRKGLVNILKSK